MKVSAPYCATGGSTAVVKSGHDSCGTQQYLCKACGAHRVLVATSAATDPARKQLVLRAVEVERLSLRAAEWVFGVARQTIAKWLEKRPHYPPPSASSGSARVQAEPQICFRLRLGIRTKDENFARPKRKCVDHLAGIFRFEIDLPVLTFIHRFQQSFVCRCVQEAG